MRRGLLLITLTICVAAPATAQQQPPRPDSTTLTPRERALQRLRALNAVGAPDTASEQTDSLRQQPQQVNIRGRAGGTQPGRTAAIARDSIVSTLLTLRDYIATEYKGDTAHYHADSSRLELRGNPQVAREGNQLAAKELIVYDQQRAYACGYGDPVLTTPQMTNPVASDTVCYYVERHVGRARGAKTKVEQGASWDMLLDDMYFDANTNNVYSLGGKFTDCDLPWDHKHYYVGAKEIKVVRENVLVARNVTWYFADVPVFWLPFMVQSLSQGRRSGILMPRFGINDIARQSARYSRRIEDVGFYFALSEYTGAELALDWFADNWTAVRGSFDYNISRQFLRGGATVRRFWRDEGGREFTLSTSNSWQPDERTQLSASANYSTSSQFIQTRTFDPRELNRSIDSNASLSRRFDWGSLSLGGSRKQYLSDNTVNWQLPRTSMSISPVTLFEALPGEEHWFSNATWNGSANLSVDRVNVGAENTNPLAQTRRTLTSSVNSSFTLGRFSWNQSANFDELSREQRTFDVDTIPELPGFDEQSGRWSTSISYRQPLLGTSSLNPGISLGGQFIRNDSSSQQLVMAPTRLNFTASLNTDLYGFFPGVGPFQRFRHRMSPSFSYNYSPDVTADSLQRRLFRGVVGAQEQNSLSIGLTQTIEGKYRSRGDDDAQQDTAAADTATGPRRRAPQVTPITLLSISTSSVVYDFVAARDGAGFTTTSINNSVTSDLLRGLQLGFSHDLFETAIDPVSNERSRGAFSPHLSSVNASFSLSGDSWLFRMLGLGRSDSLPQQGAPPLTPGDPFQAGPAVDRTQSEFGLVGTSRRTEIGAQRGAVGTWNGSFQYTLVRPRLATLGQSENQMLTGRISFQPTENWTVNWNTGYSLTAGEFTDHMLVLSRRLHDWDANFNFLKAQNGNFSFQFSVHLRANPDVKLDYSQNDVQTLSRTGR